MNHIILKELHRNALISKLSALSPDDIKSITDTNDIFSDIIKLIVNNDMCYIQNEHLKCYIFSYSNIIYIGIHSTMDYNAKNKLTQFKDNMYIHNGVYNAFISIEEKLNFYILNLDKNHNIKKIFVSGYGVAGAISTVVSGTIAEKYRNMYIVSCYTFESPPVGNKSFRKWFIKNISCNYRVVIEDDNNNNYYLKYCHVSDELKLTVDNIVNVTYIDMSFFKKIKYSLFRKKSLCNTYVPIEKYIEYLKTILFMYKSNIYRINESSHSPANKEENGKTQQNISKFPLKLGDSFKSSSESLSASPIFTSIKSPKTMQRVSPNKSSSNRPSPRKSSPNRFSGNVYSQQGPLTDEFISLIIQKLDNANYTLSKYLEQNIRRATSASAKEFSNTPSPSSVTNYTNLVLDDIIKP